MTRIFRGTGAFQFGDLRLPAGSGPHPLAIVIHGGFWRAAYDLEHIGPLCEALAAGGIATWNLEYRRVGNGGGWPVTFEDVAEGAVFVEELAARYPLDVSGVIAIGHSAGGHLALLLGARRLVKGVVSLAGVADLRLAAELRLSNDAVKSFLGEGSYEEASPIEMLPLGVPQRLIHGLADDVTPHEISARYARAAARAGDDVELLSPPDTGHMELIDPLAAVWPAIYRQIEQISAMVRSSSSSVE